MNKPEMVLITKSPVIHKRVARTRQRVCQAAARLFNRQNFDAVTIEAIVTEAAIARSTFYRLFRDKEALLRDIVAPMFVDAANALVVLDKSRPEAVINGIAHSYLTIWREQREALIFSQSVGQYFPLVQPEHDRYAQILIDLMAAIHAGRMLRNDDPELSAMLIAQTVIRVLQVCEQHEHFEQVFCSTLRGMLLKW